MHFAARAPRRCPPLSSNVRAHLGESLPVRAESQCTCGIGTTEHLSIMRFERIGCRPALSSARLCRNLLSGACAVAAAVASLAQEVASEVSTEHVKSYQLGLEAGCKRVGRNRGEEPEKADAYCGCVMRVLRENATPSQWRQAAFAEMKRQPREEALALSEHTLKFQACRTNAP